MLIHIGEPDDVRKIRRMLTALDEPTDQLRAAMSDALELSDGETCHVLKRFVLLLKLPKSKLAESRWLTWVAVNHGGEFIHKTPKSFRLGVWVCPVETWRELVRNVADILYIEHATEFEDVVMNIRGESRKYFSKSTSDLRDPYLIDGSDVYIATNLAANNAVSTIQALASAFGYAPIELDCY